MILLADDKGRPFMLNPAAIKRVEPGPEGTCRFVEMDGETEHVVTAEFRELANDMAKLRYCPPNGIRR